MGGKTVDRLLGRDGLPGDATAADYLMRDGRLVVRCRGLVVETPGPREVCDHLERRLCAASGRRQDELAAVLRGTILAILAAFRLPRP